jgi:hypothetical protein
VVNPCINRFQKWTAVCPSAENPHFEAIEQRDSSRDKWFVVFRLYLFPDSILGTPASALCPELLAIPAPTQEAPERADKVAAMMAKPSYY